MRSSGLEDAVVGTTASLLYRSLRRDSREVRLISFESLRDEPEINLRLHTFSLQGAPEYKALSYVWGSPDDTRLIVVNGTAVQASANLHAALLGVRAFLSNSHADSRITYLWVDALCINQEDTLEKNHQVAMMDAIYSEAQEVLMWIRFESAANADTALTLLEDWTFAIALVVKHTTMIDEFFRFLTQSLTAIGTAVGRDPFESSRMGCLVDLIDNEYWKRIWILQEVVLASSGRIIAGRRSISLDAFCVVWVAMSAIVLREYATMEQKKSLIRVTLDPVHVEIRGLAQINRLWQSSSSVATDPDVSNQSLCGEWLRLTRPDLSADSYSNIPSLLEKTQDLLATDPRDRIFALQNLLAEDKRALEPDYGLSEAQVYTRTTISEIKRTGTLRQLAWSGIGFTSNRSRPVGLPSWVPDQSKKWMISHVFDCNAGGTFSSAPDISTVGADAILRHKGIFCGKLQRVQALEGVATPAWDALIWKCVKFLHANWGELQGMPRISLSSWVKTLFRCVFYDHGIPFSGNILRYFIASMLYHANFDDRSLTWFLRTAIRPSPGFETVILSARASLLRKESLLSPLGMILEGGLKMDGELEEETQSTQQWKTVSGIWNERDLVRNACGLVVQEELRCIFFSDDGFFGLAPPGAQEGDSICVLLGHPFPFVIRPKGDSWELVGLARIPGMMHGEMVEVLGASTGEGVDQVLGSKVATICLV